MIRSTQVGPVWVVLELDGEGLPSRGGGQNDVVGELLVGRVR